jgi:hypothetical protein
MKIFLSILAALFVAAVWLRLEYRHAKSVYSKDLEDGGIQGPFDKDAR